MFMYKCLDKVRNTQGRITRYHMMDERTKSVYYVTPQELKQAMLSGSVVVRNLKLTSDGNRIIDASEDAGTTTNVKNNSIPSDEQMAKMMTYIDKELIDMGDDYAEIVDNVASLAGLSESAYDLEDEHEQTKLEIKAIKILLKDKNKLSFLSGFADYSLENKNTIIREIKYHSDINKDLNKHPTILAINGIASYMNYLVKQGNIPKDALDNILEIKNDLGKLELKACMLGYKIANTYFRSLDTSKLNVIGNTPPIIGDIITDEDEVEMNTFGFGKYLTHVDFKGDSSRGLAAIFTQNNNNVEAHVYKYERQFNGRFYGGYAYTSCNEKVQFTKEDDTDYCGKQLAQAMNKVASTIL